MTTFWIKINFVQNCVWHPSSIVNISKFKFCEKLFFQLLDWILFVWDYYSNIVNFCVHALLCWISEASYSLLIRNVNHLFSSCCLGWFKILLYSVLTSLMTAAHIPCRLRPWKLVRRLPVVEFFDIHLFTMMNSTSPDMYPTLTCGSSWWFHWAWHLQLRSLSRTVRRLTEGEAVDESIRAVVLIQMQLHTFSLCVWYWWDQLRSGSRSNVERGSQ